MLYTFRQLFAQNFKESLASRFRHRMPKYRYLHAINSRKFETMLEFGLNVLCKRTKAGAGGDRTHAKAGIHNESTQASVDLSQLGLN